MPEGHTLHRLARDLRRDLAGRRVAASSPQGRFAGGAAQIHGRVLERTDAYGKHLFGWFEGGVTLHVHLGLIGVFRRSVAPAAPPAGQVRLRLEGETHVWDLSGPMVCRVEPPSVYDEVTSKLGPDPLRRNADPQRFIDAVHTSRKPIGALLLDQAVIAGLGNVYRAELLYLCGIHPMREGRSLSDGEARALWDTAVAQLRLGLRRNRIVTIDPSDLAMPIAAVRRGDGVYVYRQEHCFRCGTPTEAHELGGRIIRACPAEQPR